MKDEPQTDEEKYRHEERLGHLEVIGREPTEVEINLAWLDVETYRRLAEEME